MHVDRFIDSVPLDDRGKQYAGFFFLLHRLPAVLKTSYAEWIKPFELFCTYAGKRYRVTGASRLGDVWLTPDFTREIGYELRVDLDDCSEWSDNPGPRMSALEYEP